MIRFQHTIKEILNEIVESIPAHFAVVFDAETGLPISGVTHKYKEELENMTAAYGQILAMIIKAQKDARVPAVREAVKKFKELIIETSRSYFILTLPKSERRIAVAVGIAKDAQLGWVRYCIEKNYDKIVKAIEEF